MKFIRRVPLAISGIALSLAALGNLLQPRGEAIRAVCGVLAAVLLALFLARFIFDLKRAREELNNPVAFSVLPTSTMAAMLLCVYAKPYIGFAAVVLWYASLAAHILMMLLFAARYLIGFKLQTVFPSWFVAGVGLVVASVTSPAVGAAHIGRMIFYIGFAVYFILLPTVILRMTTAGPFPEPARPTIAILTAPMSLCIVGYFNAFARPDIRLVALMLIIAVVSYLYVTVSMVSLLRLKFYPTYAAFTFPYVISAIAFKTANAALVDHGVHVFSFVPIVSEWAAIAVVAFVLVRYTASMV